MLLLTTALAASAALQPALGAGAARASAPAMATAAAPTKEDVIAEFVRCAVFL